MVSAEHLYKIVILERAKDQSHIGTLNGENVFSTTERNNSCGDDLTLYVQVKNNQIENISYQIKGCILSKASMSILADQVVGKDLSEVKLVLSDFSKMMQGVAISTEKLGKELPILHEVVKFPVRIKCVMLPFKALEKIIEEVE